ncbi:MAG: hypothetical protein P4L84_16410 [Isosphaeraceae bacterium]|nr:hypothetical protein [Isosphaeraceae bacterium]
MTFVGKILVFLIMVFALVFLGISTVVFMTEKDWKAAKEAETKKVSKLQSELANSKSEIQKVQSDLAAAKTAFQTETKAKDQQIATLEAETKTAQDQGTKANTALGVAEQNAKIALEEADSKRKEVEQLRSQKSDVEKQANEYKLRQTELNDKIRELERAKETLEKNTTDLRERNARLSTALRSHGLSDDPSSYAAIESPPAVEGEVTKVKDNKLVQLSIGSDDGLVPGHEVFLFRTKPRPEYIGKIKILSVDPDQAVGQVIGSTIQGKKIQEGDLVSSTIRPRG